MQRREHGAEESLEASFRGDRVRLGSLSLELEHRKVRTADVIDRDRPGEVDEQQATIVPGYRVRRRPEIPQIGDVSGPAKRSPAMDQSDRGSPLASARRMA